MHEPSYFATRYLWLLGGWPCRAISRCVHARDQWRARGDPGRRSPQLENAPGLLRLLTHVQHGTLDAGKSYPTAIAHAKGDHRTPDTYGCNRSMSCTLYAQSDSSQPTLTNRTLCFHSPGRSPEQRILRLRQVRHLQKDQELRVSKGSYVLKIPGGEEGGSQAILTLRSPDAFWSAAVRRSKQSESV